MEDEEKQLKWWARDLIRQAQKQNVGVTIFSLSQDLDEVQRVKHLREILEYQKDMIDGEDQAAKLFLYYIDHGWQRELREILKDQSEIHKAYRKVASYELYKKLEKQHDYDNTRKALDDANYELELIKKDPELAAWVPDWILADIEKEKAEKEEKPEKDDEEE